jgi:hypothetical protein
MAPSPALTFAGFAVAGVGPAYVSPVVMELSGTAGRRADGGGGEREVAFATTTACPSCLHFVAVTRRQEERRTVHCRHPSSTPVSHTWALPGRLRLRAEIPPGGAIAAELHPAISQPLQ